MGYEQHTQVTSDYMVYSSLKNVVLPWEAKRHINATHIEQKVALFAEELQIKTTYFADTNTMFAYLHPSATSTRLLVVGKMYALVWFLDDYWDGNLPPATLEAIGISYENRFGLVSNIATLIKTGKGSENPSPLLRGFQHVWLEFAKTAPRKWLKQFAKTVVDSLITSHESETSSGLIQTFDEYLKVRDRDAGGIYTCLLMEYAYEIFLEPEVRDHKLIATLRILACRVGGLGNDLVSYHKEQLQGEDGFNAITFLMEKQGLTLQDAIHNVITTHNALVKEFTRLENKLPQEFSSTDNVYKYVQGLKDIMSGTWTWEMTSKRYRTVNALFPSLELKNQPEPSE